MSVKLPEGSTADLPDFVPLVTTDVATARTVRVKVGPRIGLTELPDAQRPSSVTIGKDRALPHLPGYEILEELGTGGNGIVYKARHLSLSRIVALKTHFGGPFVDPELLLRLQNEAQALAKLQHPNIVQIYEVGDHQGQPYLALEFCRGGSLAKQLDGKPWEPLRAAALVETLAGAVQAAHAAGVIHRDLKPGNVLLQLEDSRPLDAGSLRADKLRWPAGPSIHGSHPAIPKVSDFGLARPSDAPTGMTTAGVAIGTPSYMSPEQARGDILNLGPAADIHALGAILYELLSGRPPFLGHNDYETIHQVINHEPLSPRTWITDLPRDLETICLKCLQKSPGSRYASAEDLAEDLGRFGRGEPVLARPIGLVRRVGRWAKRRPAAAGLIAVSIIATMLMSMMACMFAYLFQVSESQRHESERLRTAAMAAEEQSQKLRARAEASSKQTRAALDDMLSERALGWLTTQAELLPQQRAFLERALNYYETMAAEDGTAESQHLYALAQFRVALIHDALGRQSGALHAYELAIEAGERLLQQVPEQTSYGHTLAKCWINRGIILRRQGRTADADAAYRRGIEVAEAILARHPGHPDYRLDLGKGTINLAELLALNDLETSEQLTQRAIKILTELSGDTANEADIQSCLASNSMVLAGIYQKRGKLAEAEATFRQAIRINEQLVERFPNVPSYRSDLAANLNVLSQFVAESKRPGEAEAMIKRAIQIREGLVGEYPSVPGYRAELARLYNSVGITQFYAGRSSQAESSYRRCLEHWENLAKQRRPSPAELSGMASCLYNLALVYDRANEPNLAGDYFRRAVEIREELVREPSAPLNFWLDLTHSLSGLCNFLDNSDATFPEAEQRYARLAEVYAKVMEIHPGHRTARLGYGGCYCNFANLHQRRGNYAQAIKAYDQAIQLLQPLVDENPEWTTARIYLSNSFFGRANTRRQLNQVEDALADLDAAERCDGSDKRKIMFARARGPALAQAGQKDKARTLADQLSHEPTATNDALVAAARTWALLAKSHDDDAVRAIGVIRRLIDAKVPNLASLLDHADFDSLRPREDFRKLINGLSEPGP